MTAEYFLSRYHNLASEIDILIEQYVTLQSIVQRTTTVFRELPGGEHRSDVFGSTIAKMIDLQTSIDDLTIRASDLALETEKAINKIPNQKYRAVLSMYYLRGETYSSIADEIGYTDRWVRVLHTKAKSALQAILDSEAFTDDAEQ